MKIEPDDNYVMRNHIIGYYVRHARSPLTMLDATPAATRASSEARRRCRALQARRAARDALRWQDGGYAR